jgi:hypothetical protein
MEASMWHAPQFMRRIGRVLRVVNDDFTHEPLPQRWVDLIHYLDEKERRDSRSEQQQLN